MQVIIPVTPFAARCLRYEEGRAAVIDLSARHYLTHLLCSQPNVWKVSKAAYKYCTERITFNLPKRIARKISAGHTHAIGYLLHKHYVHQMLHTIHHTHGITNLHVMPLLKTYLRLRHISEDDYALEAAYKAWQRYQVKNSPKGKEITCTDTPVVVPKCQPMKLASDWVIDHIVKAFSISRDDLQGSTLATSELHAFRAALLFVLHRVTSHSYRSLAVEFGISRQSVYRNVKTVEVAYTYEHTTPHTMNLEIMRSSLHRVKSPITRQIIAASL